MYHDVSCSCLLQSMDQEDSNPFEIEDFTHSSLLEEYTGMYISSIIIPSGRIETQLRQWHDGGLDANVMHVCVLC